MAIFPPATSGTSGSNYNPRNLSMYSCGYNFRLPPLTVRDLRLDLGKNISFSDSLLRAAADQKRSKFSISTGIPTASPLSLEPVFKPIIQAFQHSPAVVGSSNENHGLL